ncbi:MAG: hypothetical protein WCR27_05575 [Eubacteriales bacterium]
MEDELDNINKQIKQGEIVRTDDKILDNNIKKQKYVDAKTSPTMSTLFSTMVKKYQEEKKNSKE